MTAQNNRCTFVIDARELSRPRLSHRRLQGRV